MATEIDFASPEIIGLVAFASFFGAVLLGATGFGPAIVFHVFIAAIEMVYDETAPPPIVITFITLPTSFTLLLTTVLGRKHISWPMFLLMVVPALFMVPVGSLLLLALDPDPVRRIVGGVVLVFALAQFARQVREWEHDRWLNTFMPGTPHSVMYQDMTAEQRTAERRRQAALDADMEEDRSRTPRSRRSWRRYGAHDAAAANTTLSSKQRSRSFDARSFGTARESARLSAPLRDIDAMSFATVTTEGRQATAASSIVASTPTRRSFGSLDDVSDNDLRLPIGTWEPGTPPTGGPSGEASDGFKGAGTGAVTGAVAGPPTDMATGSDTGSATGSATGADGGAEGGAGAGSGASAAQHVQGQQSEDDGTRLVQAQHAHGCCRRRWYSCTTACRDGTGCCATAICCGCRRCCASAHSWQWPPTNIRVATVITGTGVGFLLGLVGIPGLPLMVLMSSIKLNKSEMRSTVSCVLAAVHPVQVGFLIYKSPDVWDESLGIDYGLCSLGSLVGLALGFLWHRYLSSTTARRMVLVMLVVSAALLGADQQPILILVSLGVQATWVAAAYLLIARAGCCRKRNPLLLAQNPATVSVRHDQSRTRNAALKAALRGDQRAKPTPSPLPTQPPSPPPSPQASRALPPPALPPAAPPPAANVATTTSLPHAEATTSP